MYNTRYVMEFVLSHWWLFDKEKLKKIRENEKFTDNPYPGHRVAETHTLTQDRMWIDGEEVYFEEWSTI